MSDLSAFLNKKKAAAKKKKNKVDIEGLHRKLEKSVKQQAEEENDRQEREDEYERDENFLKEKREVDDEWIDHAANDDVELKVHNMEELESDDELPRQPTPPTMQGDGTFVDGEEGVGQQPKAQTFSWGAKVEPVAEVPKDDQDDAPKPPVKENPNVETVGKFIPSALRRQQQMGGLSMGTGHVPKVDDQELFPSLGAAADIEAKLKEEQRIEQERRDKKLAADAILAKKRAEQQAKREAEFDAKESVRQAELQKMAVEMKKQREADEALLEKQKWDRESNKPVAAAAVSAPVKPVEEQTSWRGATVQQPPRPMPSAVPQSAADTGAWRTGQQQQPQRPTVVDTPAESGPWRVGQHQQQPARTHAPMAPPSAADSGKWERCGQQPARAAPPMMNAPAADAPGAWRRTTGPPAQQQQQPAPTRGGGAWQSNTQTNTQRQPLNDRKF